MIHNLKSRRKKLPKLRPQSHRVPYVDIKKKIALFKWPKSDILKSILSENGTG